MDKNDLNLIDKIAKNNPLLSGRNFMRVDNMFFKTYNGSTNDEALEISINDIYRKNTDILVFVLDDGYAVVDVEWWFIDPDAPELKYDVKRRRIYMPMSMCEVVKNDEGITRQNELPF